MLSLLKSHHRSAVILLHEIYGVNDHMKSVAESLFLKDYDVYCPNLIDPKEAFGYDQEEEAYRFFYDITKNMMDSTVLRLTTEIRSKYERVFLVGFSAGATIAWRLSASGLYDGIVGFYGSRIRNDITLEPKCKVLLIFAAEEASFSPEDLAEKIMSNPNVDAITLEGNHGFMSPFSTNYFASSAEKANRLLVDFLSKLA